MMVTQTGNLDWSKATLRDPGDQARGCLVAPLCGSGKGRARLVQLLCFPDWAPGNRHRPGGGRADGAPVNVQVAFLTTRQWIVINGLKTVNRPF